MLIIPLLDESNHPYQFLTIRYDITEQKNLENHVRLKEKQMHSFFNLMPDSVAGTIDANGSITFLSSTFEKILGYDALEGKDLNIYEHIDD